jgi:hypothetical protein
MQTSLELYRETRKAELPKFVSVLRAVPQGRLDYRPDPKARTAQQLAWVLAQDPDRDRDRRVEGRDGAGPHR